LAQRRRALQDHRRQRQESVFADVCTAETVDDDGLASDEELPRLNNQFRQVNH